MITTRPDSVLPAALAKTLAVPPKQYTGFEPRQLCSHLTRTVSVTQTRPTSARVELLCQILSAVPRGEGPPTQTRVPPCVRSSSFNQRSWLQNPTMNYNRHSPCGSPTVSPVSSKHGSSLSLLACLSTHASKHTRKQACKQASKHVCFPACLLPCMLACLCACLLV